MLTPEQQEALLGGLASGGTRPLSEQEKAAIAQGLGTLPTAPLPPKPDFEKPAAVLPPPDPPAPERPSPAPVAAPIQPERPAPEPPSPAPARPAPVVAQTQGTESKLVRTGPEWYDYVAPPKVDGARQAAGAVFGGLLNALTADSAKDGMKSFFGGLGKAAEIGISAPQADYQNRLDAAGKQASMTRALKSGADGDNLAADRLNLAREKFQAQKDAAERERLEREALQSMHSPQTQQERAAAIAMGMKPEEADKLNGDLLRRWRTSLAGAVRQDEGQVNRVENMETTHGNALTRMDHQDQLMRERAEEKREHDRVASLEEAAVPGITWINPRRPPSANTVNEVRKLKSSHDAIVDGAARLAELQRQIKSVAHQGLGSWNRVFGDAEQADILEEMKLLREQVAADQRVIWDQGVPHEFDLRVNKKTNPEVDNPFTFFNGEGAWGAMARAMGRRTKLRLKAYSAKFEGEEIPEVAPAPQRGTAGRKDLSDEAGKTGATTSRAIEEVKDAAGAVADKVKVQVFDPNTQQWGAVKEYSKEKLEEAKKKLSEAAEGSRLWGAQIRVVP